MAQTSAPKKTLYHSELAKMGEIQIVVKSDRLKSKYSKPNDPKPDYFILLVDGYERNYSAENENCAEALTGLKGSTITIQATGGRDDANIEVFGETRTRQPEQRQPAQRQAEQRQPQQRQSPPPSEPVQEHPEERGSASPETARHELVKKGALMFRCILLAHTAWKHAVEEQPDIIISPEAVNRTAQTLYIDAHRGGLHNLLPANFKSKPKTETQNP